MFLKINTSIEKVNDCKPLVCCLFFLICAIALKAQCPDFMDLSSPNVTGYYGTVDDSVLNVGIVPGRHTLITQQGTDPRTGNQLPLLPDGESMVVKLGNEQVGGETESLIYTFTVDPDQPILLMKYAVVLEDPEHFELAQPRFLIRILDAGGELLNSCMEYDVVSSNEIPGFQSYESVRWRPWTTNGFDLSAYAGQTVKLQLVTRDCAWFAHFGYAYFTASCVSKQLSLVGCNYNQVTLSAIPGFENYLWSNGDTTLTSTINLQGNTTVSCLITTVTGCEVTLFGTISFQYLPSQGQDYYDTICQGETYQNHGFNLPPQMQVGDNVIHNTSFDNLLCTENVTNTLYLHVLQQYTHIYAGTCEGIDYNQYGFQFSNMQVGEYTDTNIVVRPGYCDSVTILHLTVYPSVYPPSELSGPTSVCSRSSANYSLPGVEPNSFFQWHVPDGVALVDGLHSNTVTVYFTEHAPVIDTITLTGFNSCGWGSTSIIVHVSPTYYEYYSDTICAGSDYSQHGFQLGVQDSAGIFVLMHQDTTANGCDSIRVLQLIVGEIPGITALANPEVLCVGSETELHAVGSHSFVTFPEQQPYIEAGDILCTDSSVVHPANWPCGKVAMGVVFHVDATGQHGWAVSLHDKPGTYQWSSVNINLAALPNVTSSFSSLLDLDGYQNTASIRAAGNATQYPAAYAVDFENGWYLPAAGQLYRLYAMLGIVNNTLALVNGTPFPMNLDWQYWSSTENYNIRSWYLDNRHTVRWGQKNEMHLVREVYNF